ncbi:MAG TPA: SDR family oxidoreductase [Gaiellaceae bacterium]|nr:SDR family oxidoreductase [Gaiellaceae bacterium]
MSGERGVAIVTGAAGGLGRTYALALAREGWHVVAADVADPAPVAAEIAEGGGSALALVTDVSDETATEALAAAALARFGRIDALVNNAAIFASIVKKPFDELSVEEWDRLFAVNVRGSWLCCKAVAPAMKARRAGRIVNVSSMTVPSGIPLFLHYVASKAAIVGLTRALARELGEWGIAVNTISPDYVPHDAEYAGRQPEMAGILAAQRCFKRDLEPDDLVGTLLYLLGPGSAFVTGQNLYVNGGRLFT